MSDVFVSYSRQDSMFVHRLADSVTERGRDVWLDTQGIADAEVFPRAIRTAIEQSDAFLFVITPASVHSQYCENEVEYARQLHKRILPVLRDWVPDSELPGEIRDRNWIPFTDADDFDESVERLVKALDRDLERAKEHTRWLVKAIEWEGEGRDNSFLLRGSELKAAEAWLAASPVDADPAPTPLQREYLLRSREAAVRRQRVLMGASTAVAVVSIGLLIFALITRAQAVSAQTVAKSRALAAVSEAQASVDPQLAILLAEQAVKTSPTPDALFALRGAIDASPLLLSLPRPPGVQCGFYGGPGVAYDPTAPRLAEALCNGYLEIFDSRTGRLLRRRRTGGFASAVAYTRDGSTLAVGTNDGVLLVDGRTGATRTTLTGGHTTQLSVSPDGSMIVAGAPTQVGIWSIHHGVPRTIQAQPPGTIPPGGSSDGTVVGLTGAGRYYLTGGVGNVVVMNTRTQATVATLPGTEQAQQIAVSNDERELAIASTGNGGDGIVSLWNTTTWKRIATFATFSGLEISALAFSPDNTQLALGAGDGTAGVWSLRTHEQLASYLGPTSAVISLAFSPDGRELAAASSDGTTNVWRAGGPEQTYIDTGQSVARIALTPSRLTVVNQATDGGVSERSWSLPAAQPGVAIRLGPRAGAWLSPDGSLMTVGPGPNAYGQVGKAPPPFRSPVWSVAQRRVIATLPTTISLSGVEFSHDDRRAAVFDEVEPAIEDIYSARRVVLQNATPCPAGWHSAAFSTDDTVLAGADFCGDVYVWNAATGRRLLSFSNGSEIARVTFAPDDDAQLAVGSSDGRITIWSLRTHRPTRILAGHTSGVTSIAYSPIGTLLASNSLDHTTRIWDPSGGRLLRVLHQPDPVHALAFSTDGRTLATGDTQGVVRVWDSCTACGNAQALLAIANRHVFRGLTAAERTTFLGGF